MTTTCYVHSIKCQKTFNVHLEFCNVKISWINVSCWHVNNREIEIDSSLDEKIQSLFHNHNHQDISSNPFVCGCHADLFTQLPIYLMSFLIQHHHMQCKQLVKYSFSISVQNNSVHMLLFHRCMIGTQRTSYVSIELIICQRTSSVS